LIRRLRKDFIKGSVMNEKPIAAGKSSFDLINSDILFRELEIRADTVLLDMACGIGRYSMAAAEIINDEGMIYAVDLWEDGIATLREYVSKNNISYIRPILADVSKQLPIEENSVDVCLFATVVHDLMQIDAHDGALKEAARDLRSQGRLAIIEFKKIEGPPGPPMRIRLSPRELDDMVSDYGFIQKGVIEVGQYNYLSMFEVI